MNKIQLAELLNRYVKGDCTPEEIEIIDSWYGKYRHDPGFTDTLTPHQREALRKRMLQRINEDIDRANDAKTTRNGLSSAWRWGLGIAATLAPILFHVATLINHLSTVTEKSPFADVVPQVSYTNNTTNIVKQTLPDSSTVWVNPQASISYPLTFSGKTRDVTMTGTCFFEVTKDVAHPFIVNSKHMVTKVWGTSFRVADAGNESSASVTVVTGKVSVTKKGPAAKSDKKPATEVMLHPTEAVVYHTDRDELQTEKHADMTSLEIWKHVNLSFDNTRLADIVKVLNQKFNAHIRVDDQRLNDAVMDADLTDLNLPDVLEVLKTSLRLDYRATDDGIILTKTSATK